MNTSLSTCASIKIENKQSSQTKSIGDLPNEVNEEILSYLLPQDLENMVLTNKYWKHRAISSAKIYTNIKIRKIIDISIQFLSNKNTQKVNDLTILRVSKLILESDALKQVNKTLKMNMHQLFNIWVDLNENDFDGLRKFILNHFHYSKKVSDFDREFTRKCLRISNLYRDFSNNYTFCGSFDLKKLAYTQQFSKEKFIDKAIEATNSIICPRMKCRAFLSLNMCDNALKIAKEIEQDSGKFEAIYAIANYFKDHKINAENIISELVLTINDPFLKKCALTYIEK